MKKSVNISICVNWYQGMVGVPWKPLLPLALTDLECINKAGLKQKPFVCLKNMCKHTYNCGGGSLRSAGYFMKPFGLFSDSLKKPSDSFRTHATKVCAEKCAEKCSEPWHQFLKCAL